MRFEDLGLSAIARYVFEIDKALQLADPVPAAGTVGTRLKAARLRRREGQKEVAAWIEERLDGAHKIQVGQTQISRWENGKALPPSRVMKGIDAYIRRVE